MKALDSSAALGMTGGCIAIPCRFAWTGWRFGQNKDPGPEEGPGSRSRTAGSASRATPACWVLVVVG